MSFTMNTLLDLPTPICLRSIRSSIDIDYTFLNDLACFIGVLISPILSVDSVETVSLSIRVGLS
jgi:hypothetical protein